MADARSFRRILCLTQQPAAPPSKLGEQDGVVREGEGEIRGKGGRLCLFRALLYDDYPDATFPHALTVRDSTSRVEFYHYPWDLVDLQRGAEEGAKEQGKGKRGGGEGLGKGGDQALENEGVKGTDEMGEGRVTEEPEEAGEPGETLEDREDKESTDAVDEEERRKVNDRMEREEERNEGVQHNNPLPLPHPAINFANHVPYAITLDRVVRLATRWLSQCDSSHPKCAPEPHTLPRRLLDLRGGVRLIDTTTSPFFSPSSPSSSYTPPEYTTLSHCWGPPSPTHPLLTTTVSTLPIHTSPSGIPWPTLPLLFQDVVLLVRSLGYQYLWIDSLCILQDSEEDWLRESANMSSIYAHAALNIAATAQRDASVSLFRRRFHGQGFRDLKMSVTGNNRSLRAGMDTVEIGSLPLSLPLEEGEGVGKRESKGEGKGVGEGDRKRRGAEGRVQHQQQIQLPVYARIGHERSHETLFGEVEYFRTLKEPILSRAWVFQERLLSRRTLHFGSSEVLWECRSGCFCECGGIERGHVLSVRNLNNNAAACWRAPGTGGSRGADIEGSGLLSPPLPLSRSSTFDTDSPSSLTCGTIPKKVLFANLTSPGPPETETTKDSRLLHHFFLRCVEEYSFLSLTKELDRSFALAGIAKRIHSLLGPSDRYLAGLWLHDLPRALLWQPYRHKKVLRAGDKIPTWSWMSRSCYPVENTAAYHGKARGYWPTASKCSVRYKHITRSGYEFEVDERLEVDPDPTKTWCEYEGGNEFGKLKGGQVTLRAAYRWGVVWTTGTKKSSHEWTGRNNLVVAIQYDNGNGKDDGDGGEGVLVPMLPDCPRHDDPGSVALMERVLVVLFGGRKKKTLDEETGEDADGPQFFLALKEVEGREGVFQRIGFLESEWRIDLFENAGVRTITLI